MKTVMIHLVNKSDFILSDHKNVKLFAVIPAELAKSEDCHFSCTELALQKNSVGRKYKCSQEISTKPC